MAARDGDPDRLDDANGPRLDLRDAAARGRRRQRRRRRRPPAGRAHRQPRPRRLRRRPGAHRHHGGGADWADAFLLAESLETAGAEIGFQILTDGGLTDADQRLIPPGSELRPGRRPVDQPGRHPPDRRAPGQRPARPGHGGQHRWGRRHPDRPLRRRRGHPGRAGRHRRATGETVDVEVDLPAGDRVEAFLEGDDLLDADDHAYAIAARRRALTVSAGRRRRTPSSRPLLGAIPGRHRRAGRHGAWPRRPPTSSSTTVSPARRARRPRSSPSRRRAACPAAGVAVTGAVERPAVTLVRPDDPLTQGLDLSGCRHRRRPAARGPGGHAARRRRGHAAAPAGDEQRAPVRRTRLRAGRQQPAPSRWRSRSWSTGC